MKTVYITSPLYYVNASPHIGHAYTQVSCDTLSRFFKLSGRDTFFLTGTDEHGEKIEEAALKAGYEKGAEMDFVDSVIPAFKKLWEDLNISFNFFIRTTDPRHEKTVQHVLDLMHKKGDIYKGVYKGWFCVPCETFWTDLQVENKTCPDCKRPLERIEESNYFFKLSKYRDWLISHIEKNRDFIKPDYRRNEILSFLKNPLQDLCVSRPKERMAWGIEIPFDKNFVTYVWFDALVNYISGAGFPYDMEKFKKLWPADFHIIGKDILRHHTIYWPIMLRSVDIEPPLTVFAHGWWTVKGEKMSKSKGNVVDPHSIVSSYGVDALRYFLMREVTFGMDGTLSEETFILRFNSDLANDLGNLVQRTITMAEKYFEGKIPEGNLSKDPRVSKLTKDLEDKALGLHDILEERMVLLDFSESLVAIWEVINKANKYIEETKPWELAKKNDRETLENVIRSLLEVIRITAVSIYPFMSMTAGKIWHRLGYDDAIEKVNLVSIKNKRLLKTGTKVRKGDALFPRIQNR